jgi:hypothetical protein
MSDFDPIKAQKEVLAGALKVHNIIVQQGVEAERKLTEAEARMNALRQLHTFSESIVSGERSKLRKLEQEAENAHK